MAVGQLGFCYSQLPKQCFMSISYFLKCAVENVLGALQIERKIQC